MAALKALGFGERDVAILTGFGYNAGIIDPIKVGEMLQHAASVARTFLTSYVGVVDIKEPEPVVSGNLMDNSGYSY